MENHLHGRSSRKREQRQEEHPETHIAIGIIDEDGEETYIENGVNLVSVLKVKKDGRYRVFIENQGTKKAIAGGYYWVETEKQQRGECDYEEIVSDNFGLCNMYM